MSRIVFAVPRDENSDPSRQRCRLFSEESLALFANECFGTIPAQSDRSLS